MRLLGSKTDFAYMKNTNKARCKTRGMVNCRVIAYSGVFSRKP